jgi:hypothetical protein
MPSPPKGSAPDTLANSVGEIEKRVENWVSSKEGTQRLLTARDSARSAAEKVAADAQVEPEQLRRAVTL